MNLSAAWQTARNEPYRVFFPFAAIVGGIGVGHWLAYSLHLIAVFSPLGHALVQVQAFLMAFACGFLLTMLPKRAGLAPTSSVEMILLMLALSVLSVAALTGHFIASQVAFLALMVVLGSFVLRRLGGAGSPRRPPDAFVLVPMAVASALIGSTQLLFAAIRGVEAQEALGRGLVLEGLFLCLVLGLGHMLWPLLTGFDIPPDGSDAAHSRRSRHLHALAGLVIIMSFPIQRLLGEQVSPELGIRVGCLLRGGVFLVDWLRCVKAWRWPIIPGLHRRFAWLAFWLVPTGEILAGLFPGDRIGLMHVTFVGGFSLLCFAVGTHVIAAHAGASEIVSGRPWQVWTFSLLFLGAMATRVTADFLPGTLYWTHLGWAALLWLIGLSIWFAWLMPRIFRVPPSPHGAARELPVIRQS